MKKKLTVLLAVAALGVFSAAAAHAAETVRAEGRYISHALTDLTPFNAVEVHGDIKVDIRQHPQQEVTLSGRANLAELANVRVENNTLLIDYKRPIQVRGKDTLHVSVFMPELTALTAKNRGEINVYGPVKTNDIFLTATDNGQIDMDALHAENVRLHAMKHAQLDVEHINAQKLEVAQFDKAEIDLSGFAEHAQLVNHGSKDLDASDLRTNQAHAAVHGRGRVEVFAVKTLQAGAHGHGMIEYHGAPILTREGNIKKIRPVFED